MVTKSKLPNFINEGFQQTSSKQQVGLPRDGRCSSALPSLFRVPSMIDSWEVQILFTT